MFSIAPDARFCYQCGMAMKVEDAMKIEESQQKLVSAMAELDDTDMNEVLKFTAKMFKLIKDDPELAERIGKGK